MSWYNNDGLYLKFGTEKTVTTTAGEYVTNGNLREIEFLITLSSLASTPTILSDIVSFPTSMIIQEIVVTAQTAATSGGSATLDIGLQKRDRSTELDYNGFIAALPLASIDATGEQTTFTPGATYAGALMGTSTSDVGYLTANYNTAAFTAGVARVRVRFYQKNTITQ